MARVGESLELLRRLRDFSFLSVVTFVAAGVACCAVGGCCCSWFFTVALRVFTVVLYVARN